MFDSRTLDIVISLIFIFLLYSLFATILQEMFANWYGLRAKMLRKSIEIMLNGKSDYTVRNNSKSFNTLRYFLLVEKKGFENSFAFRFYETPIIRSLGKSQKTYLLSPKSTKPAYISSQTFSDALLYVLTQRGIGNTDMEKIDMVLKFNPYHIKEIPLKHLQHLAKQANGDIAIFKMSLEQWFNNTQDRATGWFKSLVKLWLFLIGFGIAVSFNSDTFAIVKKLSDDVKTRTAVLKMAIDAANSQSPGNHEIEPDSIAKELEKVKTSLDNANQVLGLGHSSVAKSDSPFQQFCGYIIMALAVSLGSSFWFDLLKKLVAIRGTGIKPEEKTQPEPKATGSTPSPFTFPANKPLPVAPVADLLDQALFANRKAIMKIPGVRAVMRGVTTTGACIQINVNDETTAKYVATLFPSFTVAGQSIKPHIAVTGSPTTQQAPAGTISNKSGKNGYGSLGVVLNKKSTGEKYFISCWHVLKGDTNYDFNDKELTITANDGNIGERKSGGIAGPLDIGLAKELNPSELLKIQERIRTGLGFTSLGYRNVTNADLIKNTRIVYFDSTKSIKQYGLIYSEAGEVEIKYSDKFRTVEDILVLTSSVDSPKSISSGGNSGSVIFDETGTALGMIIGGDSLFTYAIKLQHVFQMYPDYEII